MKVASSTITGRAALAWLALIALLAFSACGGGSSGNSGGTPPPTTPPPAASIQFTPAGSTGNATIILARGAASTADVLQLEVRANAVPGLYGVSFDLSYPAGLFNFTGFTEGDFFAGGSGTPSVQVAESPDGNLIVGATLLGSQPGISGSGTILTIQLQAVAGGSGPITFSNQQGFDTFGVPILALAWVGGTAQVNR